jgi:hypothetical protein
LTSKDPSSFRDRFLFAVVAAVVVGGGWGAGVADWALELLWSSVIMIGGDLPVPKTWLWQSLIVNTILKTLHCEKPCFWIYVPYSFPLCILPKSDLFTMMATVACHPSW